MGILQDIRNFNNSARAEEQGYDPKANPQTVDNFGQNKYDFRYLTFPDNIGAEDIGHYMVININVPTQGFTLDGPPTGAPAGAFTGPQYITPLVGQGQRRFSKVDTMRYLQGSNTVGATRPVGSIPRQTTRIAESIALFMPGGLNFTDYSEYQNIELSAYAGQLGTAGLSLLGGLAGLGGKALTNLVDTVSGAVKSGAALSSNPINPMVEVLFSNKMLRVFTFEFLLAPRNEKESLNLKAIIKTLRFHASPEINDKTGLSAFWIPPADFDITFFKHGKENTNIMRINTCVLERVDVIYDPQGVYATFRNGHPVAVKMTLSFKEVEPIHKQRVDQGF